MKAILRIVFYMLIIFLAILLYQFQLGAIPFFLVSFYLFFEAIRVFRKGKRGEVDHEKPSRER